jgi:hypothetical protein
MLGMRLSSGCACMREVAHSYYVTHVNIVYATHVSHVYLLTIASASTLPDLKIRYELHLWNIGFLV